MSNFTVTILGCGSAKPNTRHMPSAQAICYNGRVLIMDCGEGTQLQLSRFHISFAKITDIFISHLHGDHFLGLPGLLSTMALHSVQGTVTVHIFREGAELLKRILDVVAHSLTFTLKFDIIDPENPVVDFESRTFEVVPLKLYHRIPCVGYIFREKGKSRHINGEMAKFYNVPKYMMNSLRDGADLELPDGRVIPNNILTTEPSPCRSYAYCSDTSFCLKVAEAVKGVDVLYHESTYGDDRAYLALGRGHSSARQAAQIARRAGVKKLVIGHYSSVVLDASELVAQAGEEFQNVVAANEGMVIEF